MHEATGVRHYFLMELSGFLASTVFTKSSMLTTYLEPGMRTSDMTRL